MTWKRARNC